MIKSLWKNLTMFQVLPDLPATNNPIENYYSTSLKTHRKKQLRTDNFKNLYKDITILQQRNHEEINGLYYERYIFKGIS
jgi:hypothetical protein